MRFEYTVVGGAPTELAPRLSLALQLGQNRLEVNGLLDTGAAVNLLPYRAGITLGAVWEEQPLLAPLVGSLGRLEARGLAVLAFHPQLTTNPIRLIFAWTQKRRMCPYYSGR